MRKFFVIPLAAIVMAMVWGCSNEQVMGGDLVPPSDKSVLHVIDTITVKAYTELEDTVNVSNSLFLIAGALDDPIFGKSYTSFAAKFSNTSYSKFKSGAVCDSVVLTLGIDTTSAKYYGDSNKPVTMSVYRLADSIRVSGDYTQYFDITSIAEAEPMATSTFVPAKADTMVSITLPREYGNQIIRNVTDTTFDDNCFGLYFTIEADNCMMMFSRSSKYTKYVVYNTVIGDTVQNEATFSIGSYDPRLSSFIHDYTDTRFYSQLTNPHQYQDTALYLQALAGTQIRVEFPYLKELNNLEGGYIAFTNATLLMPFADSLAVCEDKYNTIDNIVCSAKYNSGLHYYMEDFLTYQTGSSPWRSAYYKDAAKRRYSINITSALVKMLKSYKEGVEPDYTLYIAPNGTITDFARSVINSPTSAENPMKLVVEYLVFEK